MGPHELLPRSRLNPIVRAALGDTRWFRITRRPITITPSSGWHIMNELGLLNVVDPDTIDGSMPLPLQSTRWVTHLATHTERFLRALDDKLESKKTLLSVLRQSFYCSLFRAFYTTEHTLYERVYFPSAQLFLPTEDAPTTPIPRPRGPHQRPPASLRTSPPATTRSPPQATQGRTP